MSVNTVVVSGVITRLSVNKKQAKKGPSTIAIVQWGDDRAPVEGAPTQFVNANVVRIPAFLIERLARENNIELREGDFVDLVGQLQGVIHTSVERSQIVNEVVISRVTVAPRAEPEVPAEQAEPTAA